MIYLSVIAVLILSLYVYIMCRRCKGIPASISATYYTLEHKFWFEFTMTVAALLTLPVMLEKSSFLLGICACLICIGIVLVGTAPNFKESYEHKVHVTGATTAMIFSQIWVYAVSSYLLLLWIPFIVASLYKTIADKDQRFTDAFLSIHPLFWVEVTCLVITYISIYSLFI